MKLMHCNLQGMDSQKKKKEEKKKRQENIERLEKEEKEHTKKLEALLKIIEQRIVNGEGDEEFIFLEVQEVEKDVEKENKLKEEHRETSIEEKKRKS